MHEGLIDPIVTSVCTVPHIASVSADWSLLTGSNLGVVERGGKNKLTRTNGVFFKSDDFQLEHTPENDVNVCTVASCSLIL